MPKIANFNFSQRYKVMPTHTAWAYLCCEAVFGDTEASTSSPRLLLSFVMRTKINNKTTPYNEKSYLLFGSDACFAFSISTEDS